MKKRIVLATTHRAYWFHRETKYIDISSERVIYGSELWIDEKHNIIEYKSEDENKGGSAYGFRSTKIYRFEEQ